MSASRPIDDLREHAAKLIIDRAREVSFGKAAKDLGISRQALYDIERGVYCPSLALILRACEAWNLNFRYRGLTVTKGTIQPRRKAVVKTTQLDLFNALAELEKQHFEVVPAKRNRGSLELTLRLKVTAA
jgi:DNA-binding XRE family transcriptional regulator